jgi:hypothetical protein
LQKPVRHVTPGEGVGWFELADGTTKIAKLPFGLPPSGPSKGPVRPVVGWAGLLYSRPAWSPARADAIPFRPVVACTPTSVSP